ncbi:MAG TPA: ferric reductase-like transmembrane domain-containing protein [Ktedonobacteraceae bacterium]
MNTLWASVTWNVARAGGFTAYVLLTLAVIIGLALSTQMQSPARWPRLINNELHNFLTLLSAIFLGVHILATWIDPFTSFGWNEMLIPFASHYRPSWMAFGIISLYLSLAIGLSTWIRPRIGYKWWRRLHVLTLGIFILATIHGLGSGSDTQTPWALGIYIASSLLVGLLLWRRLLAVRKRARTRKTSVPRTNNVSSQTADLPHASNNFGVATTPYEAVEKRR